MEQLLAGLHRFHIHAIAGISELCHIHFAAVQAGEKEGSGKQETVGVVEECLQSQWGESFQHRPFMWMSFESLDEVDSFFSVSEQ